MNIRPFAAVCLLFAATVSSAESVRVINLAPRLLEIASAEKDDATRAREVEQCLREHSQLYTPLLDASDYSSLVRDYAKRLPAQVTGLRRLADDAALRALLDAYVGDFKKLFPEFDPGKVTVAILPSFGRFRGQARPIGDDLMLLLDAEFLATSDWPINRPLVHHELFHINHYQLRPDVAVGAQRALDHGEFPSLATLLWVEGMAAHAARQLNPTASNAELLIDSPSSTGARFFPLLQRAMKRLDLLGKDAISGFFYFPSADQDIPVNSGYTIGEALVGKCLEVHSWKELILLRDSELIDALRTAARELGTPPPKMPNQTPVPTAGLRPAAAHL